MRPADNINNLIKKLQLKASAELDKRVHDDISRVLAESEKNQSAHAQPNIRRIIMKSPKLKLAAAAVIVIAVLAGLPFLPRGTSPSIALGEVLAKVEQARAFMYKMNMTVTGSMMPGAPAVNQDVQTTIIISNDYGMKMEMEMTDPNTGIKVTQKMYIVPDSNAMFMIMPEQKRYTRMEFTEDLLARMKKQNNDPREMIKQMMSAKYTELGKSEIEGVEVKGFETTDPAFLGGMMGDVKVTLWVDSATWLPFLVEMDMTINEQMRIKGSIYDYEWDVLVAKEEFTPVIPDDFEPFPAGGMKMPEITEEAAIEGLKVFAELSGRYPKKANMMDLMQEITAVMTDRMMIDKAQDMTETERVTKMMETMRPIQSIGLLYMALAQDQKEPVYYGETVGPEDIGAVLMRWKTAENEYRVIFGDLSAATVTSERLAELEQQPLD